MTGWKKSKMQSLKKCSRKRKQYVIKIRFLCQKCSYISNQHSNLSGDACSLIPHQVIKSDLELVAIVTRKADTQKKSLTP